MDRELTYQMPFERLVELGRSAGRKVFAKLRAAFLLLIGLFCVAMALLTSFNEPIQKWQASVGLPEPSAYIAVLVAFAAAILELRRFRLRQIRSRADYDSAVRMREDDGGLRFATDQVEYYLKWQGIGQMLMERDGVAVSHGNLFFLIPNDAFSALAERDAFVRDVFGRLGAEAQARSEKHMRPILDASPGRA
ncbi:MAG: hypothetical protein ABI457_02995 [Hyphomicrobium sp.]